MKRNAIGSIIVSVVFRPVSSVGEASPDCHVTSLPADSRADAQAEAAGDSLWAGTGGVVSGRKQGRKSAKRHKNKRHVYEEEWERRGNY